MKVRVRLFAAARDAAGCDAVDLDIPHAATVADVRRQLSAACPALRAWTPYLLFALDHHYADDSTPVSEGRNWRVFRRSVEGDVGWLNRGHSAVIRT